MQQTPLLFSLQSLLSSSGVIPSRTCDVTSNPYSGQRFRRAFQEKSETLRCCESYPQGSALSACTCFASRLLVIKSLSSHSASGNSSRSEHMEWSGLLCSQYGSPHGKEAMDSMRRRLGRSTCPAVLASFPDPAPVICLQVQRVIEALVVSNKQAPQWKNEQPSAATEGEYRTKTLGHSPFQRNSRYASLHDFRTLFSTADPVPSAMVNECEAIALHLPLGAPANPGAGGQS